MKGKLFKVIVLVVLIMLVFSGGANASGGNVAPIPPGPETSLPDYIGAPAKAHPTANSGVPQNPFAAPNPFSHSHSDIWMSDTADIAGPLGRDPVTLSTTLPVTQQNSWLVPTGSFSIDSHGRLILNTYGVDEARVVLVDPDTLEVLASKELEVKVGDPFGQGDQKMLQSLFSIYGALDDRDQLHIVSGNKEIVTLQVKDTPSGPEFVEVGDVYDLEELTKPTDKLPQGDSVSGAIIDFQGRYWINMKNSANIYLLNPATFKDIGDLKSVNLGDGEFTRNGMALTKKGAAYIVTTEAMYRVDAGADDQPRIVWRQAYDNVPSDTNNELYTNGVRSGQYEYGSGTTPTVLGEGKYVAITDNAEQMQVVVYRTDAQLDPNEERVVCEMPVFEFPGGGKGAQSNSLVGLRNSIIVQNTFGYLFDFPDIHSDPPDLTTELVQGGAPGIERIDIDPNGKGCTKVWSNTEVASNNTPKLSTKTGLIYVQSRKWDAENNVNAYYWTALDFNTGEVVWEKFVGTGDMFDNFWAAAGVGPNGALYGTVYSGLTMLKDTP
jgi:hypothetical protein